MCSRSLPGARKDKYTEHVYLLDVLKGHYTRLLSAKWLVDFNSCRGKDEPLKRRQDLPSTAFVEPRQMLEKGISGSAEPMGEYVIAAVSYCWLTPTHPDPKGQQIATLAGFLGTMLKQFAHCADIAVFFDYGSLPQEPRDATEERSFERALEDVGLWYGHADTWVLMLKKIPEDWPFVKAYDVRGWPEFEQRVASLVKSGSKCIDISDFAGGQTDFWGQVVASGRCGGRAPPQHPDIFSKAVSELVFTKEADVDLVKAKYRQAYADTLTEALYLRWSDLHWGPREMHEVAALLPLTQALKVLDLSMNKIGDAGAGALAQALPGCRALEQLNLSYCEVGGAGAAALARVLPSCQSFEDLCLGANRIGDAGAVALAAAAPSCPALKVLRLHRNEIGNAGAAELARALRGCPGMTKLDLDGNAIGKPGCQALNRVAYLRRMGIGGGGEFELRLKGQHVEGGADFDGAAAGCCALQ